MNYGLENALTTVMYIMIMGAAESFMLAILFSLSHKILNMLTATQPRMHVDITRKYDGSNHKSKLFLPMEELLLEHLLED